MDPTIIETENLVQNPVFWSLLRILFILTAGFGGLIIGTRLLGRLFKDRQTEHFSLVVRKLVFYIGSIVLGLTVLLELGFDLRGVLATAGIATVAIGFAAQTSLSNLISGLFLIGEKPFQIGDMIRTGDVTGMVESIDLLSIKIRTMDNLYVRLPNESMLRNPVTTVTRYPIRRMDIELGVAYKEDVGKVMEVLKDLAKQNPYVLDEPLPLILFNEFGDSALKFRFGLWFEKTNFLKLRNSILREIKERFDKEGIEIPFPHMTLYTGSVTRPFPVEMREVRD